MSVLDEEATIRRSGWGRWLWRCAVETTDWRTISVVSASGIACTEKRALRRINDWRFRQGLEPLTLDDVTEAGEAQL